MHSTVSVPKKELPPPTQKQLKTQHSGIPVRSAGPVGPGFVPGSSPGAGCQPRRPILARFRPSAENPVCGGGARVGVPFERSPSPPREPRIPRNCRVVLPFHPSLAGLQALLDEVSMEPCVAQSGCRVRLCIPFASRSKPLGVGRWVALFFLV